jgi:hypothetical protein
MRIPPSLCICDTPSMPSGLPTKKSLMHLPIRAHRFISRMRHRGTPSCRLRFLSMDLGASPCRPPQASHAAAEGGSPTEVPVANTSAEPGVVGLCAALFLTRFVTS